MIKTTPWLKNIIAGGFVRAIEGTDPTNGINQVARCAGASASVRIRSGHAPTHEDRLNWAYCSETNGKTIETLPAWCDNMLLLLNYSVPNQTNTAEKICLPLK